MSDSKFVTKSIERKPMNTKKTILLLLTMVIGAALLFYALFNRGGEEEDIQSRVEKEVFFRHTVPRAEADFRHANALAIERLETRIAARFQEWENAIPNFVDDVTDFGSKMVIIQRYLSDKTNELRRRPESAVAVEQYAKEKFEMHLFSGDELEREIQEIARQFGEDLSANRKIYYSELRSNWENHPFTTKEFPVDRLIIQTDENLSRVVTNRLERMTGQSMAGFAGAELLTTASTILVKQAIIFAATKTASSAAAAATAAGGTAAVGTGGGAVAGSPCGPGCAAIGAGVGLVVGLITDIVITNKIRNEMTRSLKGLLDEIQKVLISGADNQEGLITFYQKLSEEMVREDAQQVIRLERRYLR